MIMYNKEKIELLDRIIETLSIDDIKTLFGEDLVIGALKGSNSNTIGPFRSLINDNDMLKNEVSILKADLNYIKSMHYALSDDFRNLVKAVNPVINPTYTFNQDFVNLKTKHGIY